MQHGTIIDVLEAMPGLKVRSPVLPLRFTGRRTLQIPGLKFPAAILCSGRSGTKTGTADYNKSKVKGKLPLCPQSVERDVTCNQ